LHALHHAVALNLFNDRIPNERDFGIGEGTFLQRCPGAQLVAAVNDFYLVGKPGQEEPLFYGAVTAADDHHVFAAEEEAVAGAAVADAPANKRFFARHAQVPWGSPGRDDDTIGQVFLAVGFDVKRSAFAEIRLQPLRRTQSARQNARPVFASLLPARGRWAFFGGPKAGVIFDFVGDGDLATNLGASNNQRIQLGAAGVNCGRHASRARAYDYNTFFFHDKLCTFGLSCLPGKTILGIRRIIWVISYEKQSAVYLG
jgi:hypothetical protein